MKRYSHRGEWRRGKKIRIPKKKGTITWSCTNKGASDSFLIKITVPNGRIGLMEKNRLAVGGSFELVSEPYTGRKLNVHKMFRRRPRRLTNVLQTFNLCPVSRGSQ